MGVIEDTQWDNICERVVWESGLTIGASSSVGVARICSIGSRILGFIRNERTCGNTPCLQKILLQVYHLFVYNLMT